MSSISPMVSIIISNFNDKDNLRECLSSLRQLKYSNYETIVVECGSDDGSAVMVRTEFPEVRLINEKKIGIGEALNIGIMKARGDLFLLELNSDSTVDPMYLTELIKVLLSSEDIGIVCGKKLVTGTKTVDCTGGKINTLTGWTPLTGSGQIDSENFDNIRKVDFAGVYLVKRELWEKIGGFDTEYYLYYEDTDFCYRAKSFGYEILYVPTAILWHNGSSVIGRNKTQYHYYMRKNNYRFILKNFKIPCLFTSLVFQFFLSQLIVIYFILKRRRSIVKAEIQSILYNLMNLRDTFSARASAYQNLRTYRLHK